MVYEASRLRRFFCLIDKRESKLCISMALGALFSPGCAHQPDSNDEKSD